MFDEFRFLRGCFAIWLLLTLVVTNEVFTRAGELGQVRFISIIRVVSPLKILASVLSPTPAVAQEMVTLSGQVKGLQGEPKKFVSVSMEGPGRYVALTNAQGAFTIRGVIPGNYTMRVRQGDLVAEFSRDVGSGPIDLFVKW